MKVLEMKEKIKGETVKSSEESNGKEIEETVALMYKPLSLLLLLWLLFFFYCCCWLLGCYGNI